MLVRSRKCVLTIPFLAEPMGKIPNLNLHVDHSDALEEIVHQQILQTFNNVKECLYESKG